MRYVASLLVALVAGAQSNAPAYLNPDLDFETRAKDLVARMSADEKVSQLTNAAAAVPRLSVPAYNRWNECLHGVARAGTATVFPQAIGLAASFDTRLSERDLWETYLPAFRALVQELAAKDELKLSLAVKNAGARDADEVVQLYVRDVESKRPMPIKALRGFERIHLKRGEPRRVSFRLVPAEDFTYYDEAKKTYAVEPGEFEIQVGASSQDVRLRGRVRVE